jgi:hypothetical protein
MAGMRGFTDETLLQLKPVVRKIIEDVAPVEATQLDSVTASALNSALYRTKNPAPGLRQRGVGYAEIGVASIHLFAAIFAVFEIVRRAKHLSEQREFEHNVQQELHKALIKAGMSAELARLIPVKYSGDIIRFIVAQQLQPSRDDGSEPNGGG